MKRVQTALPSLCIFVLALLTRIVYNLTAAKGYVPTYDAKDYQTMGINLLTEHCFCVVPYVPTTRHPPLWPMIIAAFYALLGQHNLNVRLFLCLVGAGTCVFVYLFARDIFGKRIAIAAGIMAALYPGLFIYDGWLYSESLFTFLLLAFCYTLYLFQRAKQLRWMVAGGGLLSLMSLTRPNGLGILALMVVWLLIIAWAKILPWRLAIQGAVVATLITVIIVIPWTIHNYQISGHQIIPVATSDGMVLLGAYNDSVLQNSPSQGMWVRQIVANPQLAQKYAGCTALCEAQRDAVYKKAVWQWVLAHKSSIPFLLGQHFLHLWTPATPEADLPTSQFPDRTSSRLINWTIQTVSIPIFLLAALGLLLTWRKWRDLLFFYFLLLFTIAESLYFYGSSRFRAPIEPILLILVAGVLWWISQQVQKRKHRAGKAENTQNLSADTMPPNLIGGKA